MFSCYIKKEVKKVRRRAALKNTIIRATAICVTAAMLCYAAGCSRIAGETAGSTEQISDNAAKTGSVIFSRESGFYEQEFVLELSTDTENGIIRYTLDGSDPTDGSPEYAAGITITDRTGEENLLSNQAAGTLGQGGGFGSGGGMPGNRPGGFQVPRPEGSNLSMEQGNDPKGADTDSNEPKPANTDREQRGPGNGGGRGPRGGSLSAEPAENVFKGTVVKAAVFSAEGDILSHISVKSYFVSQNIMSRYGSLPVVSVVTDSSNLFDEATGIYANYSQSGSDWERPVYFELFEPAGTLVVSQNMGVRINGGTTRSLAQKALRFYAKDSYDKENPTIEYEIFDGLTKSCNDDILATFKRIILRSSGNDNSGTLFRDALMQELVSDLNVDTQAARPCVAFVNGEFWGIYNIRERYDDHYFANHYDIDGDRVTVLEIASGNSTPEVSEGEESDLDYYEEMWNFFNDHSMADESSYQKALEYVDIDNLMDYHIANIYSANTDWPANNNVFWRYRTENGGYDGGAEWYKDGRYRWIIKDMDWGFGLMSDQSNDTLSHALNESSSGRWGNGFTSSQSTLIFRCLLENQGFQAGFINRFCDVMNTNYNAGTVVEAISNWKSEIEPAIDEQANRYPGSVPGRESWEAAVDKMVRFAQERAGYMEGYLQERFSLSNVVDVTLFTDSEAGFIRINDTDITEETKGVSDASSWSGRYFAGTAQRLRAEAKDGHGFVKFVVTDLAEGTTVEYRDPAIEVTLGSAGTKAEAVFE